VLKYAQEGSLKDFMFKNLEKPLTEPDIRKIMLQLLLALDLMHRKNILHRDIKPENILVLD